MQNCLNSVLPDVPREVTNQAAVHFWFGVHFGHPVAPLNSLEEAIGSWPEYATSVAVFLDADDSVGLIAPHGFTDSFSMTLRRNPTRVSVEIYRNRCASKQYAQRSLGVIVVVK